MVRIGARGIVSISLGLCALAPGRARAAPVCGSVADFNNAMANAAATSDDVTLTFDVVGVNPADFHNGKGSLAQMRNTSCNGGAQDATIKVYGTSDPLNTAHPPGTLKMEYGNQCCGTGTCGEKWADPNASAVIFTDGSEQCKVTMWVKPASVGYKLECGAGTFDAVGDNDEKNVVDQIAVLEYLLVGGGKTWELSNAQASNVSVCWVATGTPVSSMDVPVVEDVTVGPSFASTVFPDVGDLAVEAGDNQAYLKFVVPPSAGKVTSARLFMHTRTESFANGAGGEVYAVPSNQWSETTLTWNARPPIAGASLGRIGPAGVDETVSLDLGSAITGPGTYSFAVVSPVTDTNGTHFFSKEGSATGAPYLKLSYEGADGGVVGGSGGADAGATGGSGGTTSSGGAPGLTPDVENDEEPASGCACSARPAGQGWQLAALGLLLFGLRRRRGGAAR
ncbi:MAG: DNRLRE domain-containing protein [Myxococcales bacterium]|nr:DNRLRE domain-containing protein [Myxococcales bacterium]